MEPTFPEQQEGCRTTCFHQGSASHTLGCRERSSKPKIPGEDGANGGHIDNSFDKVRLYMLHKFLLDQQLPHLWKWSCGLANSARQQVLFFPYWSLKWNILWFFLFISNMRVCDNFSSIEKYYKWWMQQRKFVTLSCFQVQFCSFCFMHCLHHLSLAVWSSSQVHPWCFTHSAMHP